MNLLFFRLNVLTKAFQRGLCGLALLGLSGNVQAQLTVSPTNFSPAQSGRIWMDIGGVWNGTTVVAKDNGSAVLDGDEFSFVYTNDVATQFEFKPQIAFPAGVFIPATGAKGARIDTIGTSCPAGMAVSSLTNAAGLITLNLIPATGAGGFDLPPGCSFTLRINGMIAKTAPASTITISANALIAPTDGGATSLVTGGAKGALVRSGASTISKMPNNQTRAKDAIASWPNGLIVQNTGLGGLFDVTLNESAIVAGGGLSLIASTLIAPGATCAAGVCTQAYLAPAAALTGSAQATVTSCQGILNTLSTTDLTLATAKSTSAQVTLDLQQPLLNFTPPSFTIPFGGSVNASLTVTNTSSGAAKSSAAGGILFTTNYPALGVNIVLSPASLAAGWTYTTGVSGGVFKYNASIPGTTGSVPLSFTASESNACTFTSGVVQWTTAYSDDCGNFFNVPTQISTVTKDTAVPNVLLNKSASVGYRQIVGSAGSYTITSTGVNTAGLSGTSITVTDTLPAGITIGSITPSSGTFTCGEPCVAGSTLQWIYPKSNTTQTLTINYNAPTNVCTAGTTINNTASYSGTTNAPSSCPVNASSSVGVLLTLPAGTGVSQLYNVTGATNTIYEAGLPDGNNNGVSDKPLLSPFLNEGDLIPVIAEYSFGTATVGTWAGSLHSDNFGGLPAGAARLAASTLKVQIDLGAGAGFGPAITVPPASVVCGSGGVATNNCDTNLAINLAFLSGPGFFNSPNVAPATGVRQIRFTYSTTINDSVLPAPTLGRAQRQITQLGKLTLVGAVGGCCGNEFTQGDIYILARAVASASIALPAVLDVCQPIDAPITLSNLTPSLRLNNLQTILNTTAASDWRYLVGQPTPPYTGLYPTTVPVSFVTAVPPATTPSPTWTNLTPAQRFNGVATMTPKVFIKATQPAGVLPAPLTVQVSYDDNQTAGATRDFTGATGTTASANITVIRKADIVATVSPQTVFVVGTTVQWRVFITNTGSGTAYGATFSDTLPGPLTPNPAATNTSNNTTSCAPVATPCIVSGAGQVVAFNLGDIPPGQTRAVNIVATVNNSAPTCPDINSSAFNAKWGCGEPFENAQSINPARPTFVFPRGQLIVQHDSASSTCVLCGVGSTVIRLRNTGATNVFNMSLTETLNPTPQGVTLIGSDYSLDGISWTPINNLGAPTNVANSTYTWTSTQVPALAQLWPMVLTTPTQPFEVLIRLNFSTNNLTASVANPQFIAQTTGIVACGLAVDTGAQAFNLTVQKPLISVAKTATNRSAIVSPGAAGTGVFTESVFGGAGDVIEWKVVVTNTGTAPALNVRLTDVFAATGGTGQQIVAGPSCTQTPAVAYPINLSNGIATANLCNLPNTVGSNTHTYYIRETIGSANACVTATNTADVTYGCSAGGGLNGRSGIAGGSDPASIIRAPNFGTFTSAGAQTFIQEAGGRMRVEVVLDNTGGTAQTLSLANTLPAGWKLDTSFAAKVYGSASGVAAASCTAPPTASAGLNYTCTCTSTACLTGVTVNNTNAAIPVFTLLGQMRNATQARLVFYVLPTNYDATSATTFPNLATNEGNPALDPVPLVAANNSIALNVGNTCSNTNIINNSTLLNSAQPDLDIFLNNAANSAFAPSRVVVSGTPETFNFRVRNVGEPGSTVATSTFTVQLGNGWTLPTVQIIGVAGSAYTGAAVACAPQGAGVYLCTQPSGTSIGLNRDYTVQVLATPTYTAGASLEVSGVARGLEPLAVGTAPANSNLHSFDKAQYRVVGADMSKQRVAGSTSETATAEPAAIGTAVDLLIGEEVKWALRATLWGMSPQAGTTASGINFKDTYASAASSTPNRFGWVGTAASAGGVVTPVAPAAVGAAPPNVLFPVANAVGEVLFERDVVTRALNHASVVNGTMLTNFFGVEFSYANQKFRSSDANDGFTAIAGEFTTQRLHAQADAVARLPNVTMTKQVCNPSITTCNVATGTGFSNITSGDATHEFIFRIVLNNTGSAPAFDVSVQDTLQSPKLIMLSGTIDGLDNDQNGAVGGAQSEGAFTIGAGGSVLFNSGNISAPSSGRLSKLDPGVSQVLVYKVGANTSTVVGGDLLNNLATLTYSTLPGGFGNQTASNRGNGATLAAGGGTGERVLTSTATASISFSRVYGRVYLDQNHNNSYEPSDSNYVGSAVNALPTPYLCAQLIVQPAGTLSASQVLSPIGAYSFATAPAGTYDVRIVLASSATTCPAAVAPPWNPASFGYIPTEAPTQSRSFTVSATQGAASQDFGLFRGTKVTGKVFLDNTGATANDGVFNAADTGINGVPVCASLAAVTSCSAAGVLDSTFTDANGDYTLWVPLATAQPIVITNAGAGRTSTGASVGGSPLANGLPTAVPAVGGVNYTYNYGAVLDRISFPANPGNAYGTLNFGEILPAVFTTDDARTVPAGSSTLYAHTFTAATAGTVNFSTNGIAAPAGPWTEQLYLDLNCNGQIDATDTIISAPIAVVAGQTLCIIHRENVPAGSASGVINTVTVSAAFTASNNVLIPVQTITRTDVTTVTAADSGALTLLKEVCNATVTPACNGYTTQNTGKGGDLLRYRITYTNTGSSAVNNVVIQDATPPHTTFQSADAGALPNSLTACNKTTPAGTIACNTAQIAGGTGSVKWIFTGTLLSGQSGTVTFVVQVQP